MIVLNHLTNKFQPLDISVGKATKFFISGKYNIQIANKVSNQLNRGISMYNVKIALQLGIIKPLHCLDCQVVHTYVERARKNN